LPSDTASIPLTTTDPAQDVTVAKGDSARLSPISESYSFLPQPTVTAALVVVLFSAQLSSSRPIGLAITLDSSVLASVVTPR
jgi:hypothetical protein